MYYLLLTTYQSKVDKEAVDALASAVEAKRLTDVTVRCTGLDEQDRKVEDYSILTMISRTTRWRTM